MLTATGLPMRLASRWPSAPFCKKSHVDCKYRLYAANPSQQSSGVELITSNGNSFVKHCVKLRESAKYRQEARRVLVVGQTPIKEILGMTLSHGLTPSCMFHWFWVDADMECMHLLRVGPATATRHVSHLRPCMQMPSRS
jgi:hypothetical protein